MPFFDRFVGLVLEETRQVGVLALNSPFDTETADKYVNERLGALLSLLEAIEGAKRYGPIKDRMPFLSYSENGSPELRFPPGGYTSTTAIVPSRLVKGRLLNWYQVTRKGAPSARFIRAGFSVMLSTGWPDCIEFLLDLMPSGHVIDDRPLIDALLWLGCAKTIEGNMDAMIRRTAGTSDRARAEVVARRGELKLDWIAGELSPAVRSDIVSRVVARVHATIDSVRDCEDFDGWFVRQSLLSGWSLLLFHLVAQVYEQPPLPLRPLLAKLEEIRADAGGMILLLRSQLNPPYAASWDSKWAVACSFMKLPKEERVRRFFEERTQVPRALMRVFEDWMEHRRVPTEHLPERWRVVSWRLAHAYSAVVLPANENWMFYSPTEDDPQEMFHVLERAGTLTQSEPQRAMGMTQGVVARMPFFCIAHREHAIALDESGRRDAALEAILTGIYLDPLEPLAWRSLGVILHRLGAEDDAMLAITVHQWMERRAMAED